MRLSTLLSLLPVFASPTMALTSSGCGGCTLIGYENGLTVGVGVPATPAMYRVEVEAEGDVLSLSYQFTAEREVPGCESASPPTPQNLCHAGGQHIEISRGFTSSSDFAVQVNRLGEDLGPADVAVRVFRGDTLVTEGAFHPQYKIDYPNGPGCGTHIAASVMLEVL